MIDFCVHLETSVPKQSKWQANLRTQLDFKWKATFELVFSNSNTKHLLWFKSGKATSSNGSVKLLALLTILGTPAWQWNVEIAEERAPREEHGGACWPGRLRLASSRRAALITKGHGEVIAPVTVLLGRCWRCDQQPLLIARVNHSLTDWTINGGLLSPPPLRLCWSSLLPSLPAVNRRQEGDSLGLLSLPAQRLALQEDSHLTPGEENPFFSAWEKPCNEDTVSKMRRKQQRQEIRGEKKRQSFGGKTWLQPNEKETWFSEMMG